VCAFRVRGCEGGSSVIQGRGPKPASADGEGLSVQSPDSPSSSAEDYGFWKPASRRSFCVSGVLSHFTKAAASLEFFDDFRVAAG
jgi:hypothetical protein